MSRRRRGNLKKVKSQTTIKIGKGTRFPELATVLHSERSWKRIKDNKLKNVKEL